MSQSDMPDDDELRAAAAKAGAQFFDAYDNQAVVDAGNEAAVAMMAWAKELLRAGMAPEGVAGSVTGAAGTVALTVCALWANGDMR